MPKQAPSVYLLAGTEQFLKEENLNKIKSSFLDKASQDFNFNTFYAGAQEIEKVLECASTAPFLGSKRIVLLRGIEQLAAADKKLILSCAKSAYKHTVLVLETAETNLSEGCYAEISQYAQVILCQPLKENELLHWIKRQVEQEGKKIAEKAKHLLVENLGSNLELLSNALVNLVLYIGEKETIEVSDVEKLVGADITASAFELFDAVSAENKLKSLRILNGLLQDGINSSQILGALAHKIIAEKNSIKPGIFARCLQDLQRADADIKSGRQNQRLALELLLVRLLEAGLRR